MKVLVREDPAAGSNKGLKVLVPEAPAAASDNAVATPAPETPHVTALEPETAQVPVEGAGRGGDSAVPPWTPRSDRSNSGRMTRSGSTAKVWYNQKARGQSIVSQQSTYILTVTTGSGTIAGTDANVLVCLEGTAGKTSEYRLSQSSTHKDPFEADHEDVFEVVADNVGELKKLHIRQDGKGLGSDWKLDNVIVEEKRPPSFSAMLGLSLPKQYVFVLDDWLKDAKVHVLESCACIPPERYTVTIEPEGPLGIHLASTESGLVVAGAVGPKAQALGVRAGHYIVQVGETEIAKGTSKETFHALPELSKRPLHLMLAAVTVPKTAKVAPPAVPPPTADRKSVV